MLICMLPLPYPAYTALHCRLQATFRNQNDPAFQDSVGRLLLAL